MRVITRGDMDGLACTVFIFDMENYNEIYFAHPKDMNDGIIPIKKGDIIVNLPYHKNCSMWFDHHISEEGVAKFSHSFKGKYGLAPSAARIIYEYYNSPKLKKYEEMLEYTDRIDSANLTEEEVDNPTGWILLSYTADPRSGLGDFKEYFMHLLDLIRDGLSVDEILKDSEVKYQVEFFLEQEEKSKEILRKYSSVEGNLVITDTRNTTDRIVGNRFLIYRLFPEVNISARVFWGKNKEFVVFTLGHSIFNRTSNTNVGTLMMEYGGGGHKGAGTCQLPLEGADESIEELISRIQQDG